MAPYRFQVELAAFTGVSADKVVNVFHSTDANDAAALATGATLISFYSTIPTGGTNAVGEYLGTSISRTTDAATIKIYDLADPTPRLTIGELFFTIPAVAGGTNPMPRETALCLSFHADFSGGVNRARRRGRVYIGPLDGSAVADETSSHDVVPNSLFLTDLAAAASELLAASPTWAVYSRVDNVARPVVAGWIDNALDTQRRRGTAPDSRTLWS